MAGRALNSKSPTPSNSQDTLRDYLYNKRTNGRADERTNRRADERTSGWMGVKQPALSLCRFVVSSFSSFCRFVALSFCRLGSVGSKGFYGAILAGRALNSKSPTPSNSLNPLTPSTPSQDNKKKRSTEAER